MKINFLSLNVFKFQARILKKLSLLLPDKLALQIKYYRCTGQKLNLNNPKTFQEKLQWLKLYNRHPEYITMVDKIEVKKWVAARIGKKYIIPTYGIWEKVEDIDFENLPSQFAIKTNHDSGGVIICKDKSTLDIKKTKEILKKSLQHNFYANNREWPYKFVKRKVFAEKYLEVPEKLDLTDYKLYCFNGEPKYIQVIQDRNTKETIDFFDNEWNHMEFIGLNEEATNAKIIPPRPENLEDMLLIAKKLSKGINFLRVDLYNIDSKIYFGELTFFPASGFGKFRPKEWALKLGDLIKI